MPTEEMIRLVQAPVIEEQLEKVKAAVTARVQQVSNMACTVETIKDVKQARTELNKELQTLEDRRKYIKAQCMEPYNEMEAAYKECVATPYKVAIAAMDAKISAVEGELKSACEKRLRVYFTELCQRERLDWLPWHRAGVSVDLTSAKQKTPQKLMDRIAEFVARVATERDAINRMPDADEIMVEFRQSLSMASAVETVRRRHEELSRVRQATQQNAAAEAAESAAVARVEAAVPVVVERPEPVQAPTAPPMQSEQLLPCTFTVTATKSKLIKLRNFLKQEGIQYVCK